MWRWKSLACQQNFSTPTPSLASFPSFKFRQDQKGKASGSKSQGSGLRTKTYPTFPKCGKNHPDKWPAGKEGCFGCGQFGHRLRDCLSQQGQRGSNGRAYSKTSAGLESHPNQQCNSSSTGANRAKTDSMLSRLTRIRKILLM